MHDFRNFPELTNAQMDLYYWESPFKQIFDDFSATCVKVHDGDTITLRWNERAFAFPLRLSNISAREMKPKEGEQTWSSPGKDSQSWLEQKLLNKNIEIKIDKNNRVEKWGRLLGQVELDGIDIGEMSIMENQSVPWAERLTGTMPVNTIPDFNGSLPKI
mgnify:CR=1 FL=1